MSDYIIEFNNITKTFGGTVALNDVSLGIEKGKATGLVGENGAGKSTLVKICAGVFTPEKGEIIFQGEKQNISSPEHAERLGISFVHQEIPICNNLTVAQNIFLGPDIPGKMGFPDKEYMHRKTIELFNKFEIDLDPGRPVSQCSMGQKQLIMIARSISREAQFILMDEPTTALSPNEVEVLYDVIERLKKDGISILFISHRLNEVMKVSDRICVLKDGDYVGDLNSKEATEDKIASMMVGRDVKMVVEKETKKNISSETALEVKNLSHKKLDLEDINFKLNKGEVIGIAGLQGAGRTDLARCIVGNYTPDSGEIYVNGEKVTIESPSDAIENGIGYLPEDKSSLGLFQALDVKTNMSIAHIDEFGQGLFINQSGIRKAAEKYQRELNIKMSSINQSIRDLSGGNQQKVLLARWLIVQPDILILDEPTQGIDVGTKTEIRKLILNLVEQGYSIIIISSEMLEVMAISDRILVMSRGHITGEFSQEEATEEKIMKAAVKETAVGN